MSNAHPPSATQRAASGAGVKGLSRHKRRRSTGRHLFHGPLDTCSRGNTEQPNSRTAAQSRNRHAKGDHTKPAMNSSRYCQMPEGERGAAAATGEPPTTLLVDHSDLFAVARGTAEPIAPGLVQQTDQIAASRDLSLLVGRHSTRLDQYCGRLRCGATATTKSS
jgi:hypothetical protein